MRPAYDDTEFVAWLLDTAAAVKTRGTLVKRLVRGADGRARGWFVYLSRPGAIAQVLQIAAADRDMDDVVDHLLRDAWNRDAAAMQGRLEGHVFRSVSQRRGLLHASGYLSLLHGRNTDVLHAVQSGRALLTRLEGEWWMGHHLEPFGGAWSGTP
jgi:hypothetical protein